MKSIAYQLHEAFNGLTRFHFPFEEKKALYPKMVSIVFLKRVSILVHLTKL